MSVHRKQLLDDMVASTASGSCGLVLKESWHACVDVDSLLPTDVDVPCSLELVATKQDMLEFWKGKLRKQSVAVLHMKTPEKSDRRWHSGVNTKNKSRTYRVVAPLWYWKEIFRNADLPHFLLHAGVRMKRQLLNNPHFVIYFVRSSVVRQQLEKRPVSYASNWMLHDLLTIWDQSGGQHEFGASC